MRKVHIVSSLLVAFGLSIFSMGCDPAKKPATSPIKKPSGPGSTTGGGTEIPSSTVGIPEKPEEKPAEEKKPEDKPAEDKPAEDKTEAKPEEKKADEKPAEEKKADDKPAEDKKAEDK